jgi:hypothetical protein
MQQFLSILGLAVGGYFVYKIFTLKFGDPLDQAAEKIPNQNFYTHDHTTLDTFISMGVNAPKYEVKVVDEGNLYNVTFANGVSTQVDAHGLQYLREETRPIGG